MADWEAYLDQNQSRFLDELIDFLRIPSISSLSEHSGDVDEAARWSAQRLTAAGLKDVQVLPTGGHPVVYGHWLHAPGKPTVLIYGHFDVQPVDPLDLWTDPPFEPAVRDNRLYARGASDDKGNLLVPILAVEALLKTSGTLPVNVKFLLEGQEEIGSPQLPDFVENNKKLLACDLVLSADGSQWTEEQPTLIMGLRGLCALQVDVRGPSVDLHSGTYGGSFLNPIQGLVRLLESLHGPDGRVRVAGFYDQVQERSAAEREEIARVPFESGAYQVKLGVDALYGESGFTTHERVWIRPTLEINGIWGGFQGEGIKTVIPSTAHAKISCRLVPDQTPQEIREKVRRHLLDYELPGLATDVRIVPSGADPYLVPAEHYGNRAAARVFRRIYDRDPLPTYMGGTIPVCGILKTALGAYTINFGFALDDENVHSPNEFFRLDSFVRGQRAYVMLLEELGARDM